MIFNKQKFLHRPEEGSIGDCWRTCIACFFNLLPEDVPHFSEPYWDEADGSNSQKAIRSWLKDRGYGYVEIPFRAEGTSLEEFLSHTNIWAGDAPVMISGTSKNNINHIVIAQKGEIIWDPARDDSGLIGPASGGYWWIVMITKL